MQDVFGMSCEPRRFAPHRFGYVAPMLWATIFAALGLHLLVEFVFLADLADPASILSVLMGMAAVLLTLTPVVALLARRARRAWSTTLTPPMAKTGRSGGSAIASGPG